jgi:two-component system, chemotaxis family, chemotaxis protein CheY
MGQGVLIVDDLPFMRGILRDTLLSADIPVAGEASNGREALVQYVVLEPEAVLLDITMPVMDGLTALHRIMKMDSSARIVMCSSLGEQDMILKSIRLGARDFIVKPFHSERVISAVRKVLQNHGG